MNTHYMISLCSLNSDIDFINFKIKSEQLLTKTLEAWIKDPLEEIEVNLEVSYEYHFYFKKLSKFRDLISKSILSNYGFKETVDEKNNKKFILYFDIDNILKDFQKRSSNNQKVEDCVEIIEELTIKFKSFNYLENLTFLFDNECNELPEEMKKWNIVVKEMFREKSFIIIE